MTINRKKVMKQHFQYLLVILLLVATVWIPLWIMTSLASPLDILVSWFTGTDDISGFEAWTSIIVIIGFMAWVTYVAYKIWLALVDIWNNHYCFLVDHAPIAEVDWLGKNRGLSDFVDPSDEGPRVSSIIR